MKREKSRAAQKRGAFAIGGTLVAAAVTSAFAQSDPTVVELTTRSNTVEAGVFDVSKKSYKFGEYNGMEKKGAHGTLNFDVGGKGDAESALFWSAEGTNLGLDSRRLEAQGGQQGTYNLRFIYDELPHRISDTFRTIYNGAGTTSLTLPSSYPAAATRAGSTTTANNALANWNNIQAPDAVSGVHANDGPGYLIPSLMHNEDIGFKRTKIEGGFSFALLPGLDAKLVARQDEKKGTKLTGFAFNSASTGTMLVEPISFKTSGFDLSLAYVGEQANANLAYLYSSFKNDIGAWTAATPFAGAAGTTGVYNNQALLSSAPESQMHQLKLSGGYRFASTTRLAYEASTSRTSQNSPFNCQVSNGVQGCLNGVNSWSIPVSSANAKVLNDTVSAKLSSRPLSQLTLVAGFKYDRRDNQTPVNTFNVRFADQMGAANTPITNDPINTKKTQYFVDADYAFAKAQAVKLGFQRQNIDRTSDGNGFAPSRTGATANTNDFTLPVHKSKEDTWNVEYRNSMVSDLTGRVSYSQSTRRGLDYSTPSGLTSTTVDNAALAILLNSHYGVFRDSFVADRTRDKLRLAANYQMNNEWSLGGGLDFNRDKYTNAGLQEAKSTILNLDLAYSRDEKLSVNTFYSYEDRISRLVGRNITQVGLATGAANEQWVQYAGFNGGAVTLCGNAVLFTAQPTCTLSNFAWGMDQSDKVHTFGITAKLNGLLDPKLDLKVDLAYIHAKTPIKASGGSLVSNGAAGTAIGTPIVYTFFAPANYDDITSKTIQFRITGNYMIDKSQTIRVGYMYQRLRSSDWQYDAYVNPVAMQSYIGTGQTSPNYSVNVIGASYIYTFQ